MAEGNTEKTEGMGDRLKEERLKAGLKRSTCAEMGLVTVKTQCVYERNDGPISSAYLRSLDKNSNVDIYYIITGKRKEPLGVMEPVGRYSADSKTRIDENNFLIDIYEALRQALNEVESDLEPDLIKTTASSLYETLLTEVDELPARRRLMTSFVQAFANMHAKKNKGA